MNEVQSQQDKALKADLAKVRWPIDFGTVKVQIRDGKVTIATIERTIKMD